MVRAVMLFKPGKSPDTRTIPFRGLDRAQTYTLTFQDRPEQNVRLTGGQLMDNGLTVTIIARTNRRSSGCKETPQLKQNPPKEAGLRLRHPEYAAINEGRHP